MKLNPVPVDPEDSVSVIPVPLEFILAVISTLFELLLIESIISLSESWSVDRSKVSESPSRSEPLDYSTR